LIIANELREAAAFHGRRVCIDNYSIDSIVYVRLRMWQRERDACIFFW
jgi:hypothetical protein